MDYKSFFYFDIETVGQYKDLSELKEMDKRGYELFVKKYDKTFWMKEKDSDINDSYINNSPIFSTFGKIVCISFGWYSKDKNKNYIIKSISGHNEEDILLEFSKILKIVSNKFLTLSGFNIKAFDIPWIVHKMNKYNINLPKVVNIYGKKPWEIMAFDLADEWKQRFSHYYSFDEVVYELGIESPKISMDGSQVHDRYWLDDDLDGIVEYCENDVKVSILAMEKVLMEKGV